MGDVILAGRIPSKPQDLTCLRRRGQRSSCCQEGRTEGHLPRPRDYWKKLHEAQELAELVWLR